ncbi:ribonucleoside-diphosphate reductase, adenosylcobalamin-dependent [Candidatus Beckwithbacteria bacterium CG23_combo_of_CG06-09_8_20_14_all_34_8]|uniref:Vitamin B12-dependent ribonucleotide reductase n=1 Tax=Candidatus Beckwithbacteria bacterium CG23_combo_of_CG06-09_8_20_14_all_34_8 TaxID=1974497 RepID=A0A2H0B5L0_9BACT|nr:MAG: ribonucleoside-diphosphate reductase, adenosylcobalamin-dependent [Candidatus Beckwithbacteria bacterium CG23_combo_of_CG06-09_8_20_14_all_34_8]
MKKLVNLPSNALDIFIRRYSLRKESGESVETADEIFARVARVVAETENRYRNGHDPDQIRQTFFDYLCDLRFIPNGRTIANAGTGSGQLANCFVLPIEDDLGKMPNSIFATLRNAVLILQSGGGVGFSFGNLRQKGGFISTSKGKATGAVSFLKIYDTAFWVIGQGGGRRSACMAVLPVNHPDIFDFIRCKKTEGEIEHFNISVGITDEFMQAVQQDKLFDLIDPHTKEVVKKIKARKIFNEIANFAHRNGEPGVLFLDAANRDNPVPQQYTLEATNPCGEQWLGPGENCCMASVNLREHVKTINKKTKRLFDKEIDWEKLRETVEISTRFLDDVVDANKYVPAVPLLEEAAHKNRRIGLSIMGLADMFYLIGIRYGSKQSEDVAGQLMEFIRFHTLKTSVALARQRGAFPGINQSVYTKDGTGLFLSKHLVKPEVNLHRPNLDWIDLKKEIKKYGLRNAAQNTIAPTGAIATISGLEGYGCEPVFSLSYKMKTHEGADFDNGQDFKTLYYESILFAQTLKKAGLSQKHRDAIFDQLRKEGSCQSINLIPKEIKEVFVVSSDLTAKQHVRMQAALQRFVDNSISKTINFPSTASVEEVKDAYMLAWKLGCKGITVYVTGSREEVVLETGNKNEPYATEEISNIKYQISNINKSPINLKKCPECKTDLVKSEGCVTCPKCGWSKCDV